MSDIGILLTRIDHLDREQLAQVAITEDLVNRVSALEESVLVRKGVSNMSVGRKTREVKEQTEEQLLLEPKWLSEDPFSPVPVPDGDPRKTAPGKRT